MMSVSSQCTIVSLNVRGLRDVNKRRSIFLYLKDLKAHFYFLQETYSSVKDELIWRNEWGGEIFFSHGSQHSRGVCILIDRSVNEKVECTHRDSQGRILLISMTSAGMKVSLCNIYAPNNHSDQLLFIQELNNLLIDKSELTSLVVGGDWNCTLYRNDKKGGAPWRPTNYRNCILITMDALDLHDIYRKRHPKLNKYTYASKALNIKSRIDFFLISSNLTKFVKKVDIKTSIAPDHNTLYLTMSWSKAPLRGPGFWKFNNELLKDDNFIDKIREMYPTLREKLNYIQDKGLFWELLKMELRTFIIGYSKRKAITQRKRESEIKERLEELDKIICNSNDLQNVDTYLRDYEELKHELLSIYDSKSKAAMFRSKCRWIENGEKATKYFFNLEKRNYNRKTVFELESDDGVTITDEKEILLAIETFYENLYSSDITDSQCDFLNFSANVNIPKLSEDERDEMEGALGYDECEKIIRSFEKEKSPGEDGFTVEFYQSFFDLIGPDLVASLNFGYHTGKLSISQRRGTITLIPKEDESLTLLQNWRPITLLNVDYKIASKAIAKRLEPLLPKIVHPDQTGFIKGRYIGENIRLISDILDITLKQKLPGILISLDFRKAFDTLEWPFMYHVLECFNFGESVKRWIKLFYTDIETAVMNNGFSTKWFKPSRGVRQGCPLSPYLFILAAEMLSNKIRQSPDVRGICIFGQEIKLNQFADDTNFFCSDLTSVKNALNYVNEFGRCSGLKLNLKKTKAMWLGKWAPNDTKPLQLKWVKSPTKILGTYISYDETGNENFNFNLKVQKLQSNLDMWKSRALTLYGKILIIKSLGISQLVHSFSNTCIPKSILQIVKDKLFKFLWNNKKDKIKREGVYQNYDKGGLCMVDIDLTAKSLRLGWISRLLQSGESNWSAIPNYYFKKCGGLNFLLRCNYEPKYFEDLPKFYIEMLNYFKELKCLYQHQQEQNTILFNNKNILIGGKPIFYREWFSKGIISIGHLLNENGKFMSFSDFQTKYDCRTNFLQFY